MNDVTTHIPEGWNKQVNKSLTIEELHKVFQREIERDYPAPMPISHGTRAVAKIVLLGPFSIFFGAANDVKRWWKED